MLATQNIQWSPSILKAANPQRVSVAYLEHAHALTALCLLCTQHA